MTKSESAVDVNRGDDRGGSLVPAPPPPHKYEPYERRTAGDKLRRMCGESPLLAVSLVAGAGVAAAMLYNARRRSPGQKLSVYLIHTRLMAQGTVVGALTAVMAMQLWQ